LLAEPSGHVKKAAFEAELQDAVAAGLEVAGRPVIRRNQAALLKKAPLPKKREKQSTLG